MPRSLVARALLTLAAALIMVPFPPAGSQVASGEATVCHEGTLARQRTEIDADIVVGGFDPTLGELLEVQVPNQSVHLDTDAVFENTAQTAVTFAADMTYQVTFTSPAGLPSPASLAGTIPRVPTQAIAAFDGTLDFAGPSSVAQPSTTRDAVAAAVASTDPAVLAAFSGGSVAFHVATAIGETFTGGGGNIEAKINTFGAASVRVCYRYAIPASPPPRRPPPPPEKPPAPVPVVVSGTSVTRTETLAFTGAADAPLAGAGVAAILVGVGLVRGARRRVRLIDVGGIDPAG